MNDDWFLLMVFSVKTMRVSKTDTLLINIGDTVLLYTDGVKSHFDINTHPEILTYRADDLAKSIIEYYGKSHDDAACIAIKRKLMIHLGEINIRDQDSVIEIRKKIHELARSLELNHVDATRLATFSSEITQSLLLEGNRPKVELNLDSEASAIKLVLTFYGIASFAKEDLYRPFFDRLDGHFTDDTPCKVVTIKTVPLTMESLSETIY